MSVELADAEPTISIGQLRQNPTEMIRAVRQGAEYVLTDHGVPTARIVPFRRHGWVRFEDVRDALREPADPAWIRVIDELRDSAPLRDPWGPM